MKKLLLFISLIFNIVLVGCGVNEEHTDMYIDALTNDSNISSYITDEISFKSDDSPRKVGELYHEDFVLNIEANEQFNSLSKDDKYYKLREIGNVLDEEYREILGNGSFDCGDGKVCEIKKISLSYNGNTYETDYATHAFTDTSYALEINGEGNYRPEKESKEISERVDEYLEKENQDSEDTETTVENKSGEDWLSLSENQKFHAVSNALYYIDLNGYTISENEYYYIDVLDEYYSDSSNRSTPVDKALANIGIRSGTIN